MLPDALITAFADALDELLARPVWTDSEGAERLRREVRVLRAEVRTGNAPGRIDDLAGALRRVVTAYHEAGHAVAYLRLAPRDRIRLDDVRFTTDEEGILAPSTTYTFLSEPPWPDPHDARELVVEIACLLAGKAAEPTLTHGLRVDGTDLDDLAEVDDLLLALAPERRHEALSQARALLLTLDLDRSAAPVAALLYDRWEAGEPVTTAERIEALLGG
ncbi:hypothetical protein [Deinococcus pimensis]|uniref:hypothetical protein n=1 Tax=Deinococcus pimensis TaxID=309888 RepID=UPI000485794F|nr:hypothetical protein [Deinococcus pimensis]